MSTLVAALGFVAFGALPAAAQDGGWAELARRIAAAHPHTRLSVRAGAEPAGFVFPLSARPPLRVLGSAWWPYVPGATPRVVHLYYLPSARTTSVAKALVGRLTGAGYVHLAQSRFPNAFVGEYGPLQVWCPANRRGPEVDVNVETVGGLPALDLVVYAATGPMCWDTALYGPSPESTVPALGGIPGMRIYPRIRGSGGEENFLAAGAVIRTTLPPATAVARLAERFAAKGWRAEPAVADGTAIVQRFSRVAASYRWDALLLFTGGDGTYDAVLDVTRAFLPAGR